MSEPQTGAVRSSPGWPPFLHRPAAWGRWYWSPRKLSGAWIGNLTVLEPYRPLFIGCGASGAVLHFEADLPARAGMQAGEGLRDSAGARHHKLIFLDRGRALVTVALGLCRFNFLLTGVHHEETVCLLALATAAVARCGPLNRRWRFPA